MRTQFFHQPFRQFRLYRQAVAAETLHRRQPFLLVALQNRLQFAQVIAAKARQITQRQPPPRHLLAAGRLQQQAVAQHAKHGFGNQRALIRAQPLSLKKITQRRIRRMCQRQHLAHGQHHQFQSVFSNQHNHFSQKTGAQFT